MKKNFILIIVSIFLIVSLVGCSNVNNEMKAKSTEVLKVTEATDSTNTKDLKTVSEIKSTEPNQKGTISSPEGTKAWGTYIQEVVRNYEILLVEAINTNDFTQVEPLLIPGSDLYNSQKKLIDDLFKKRIQEKLIDFDIQDIEKTDKEDIYKVYVTEKIGIKYPDKQEVEIKEFNWIYTVLSSSDVTGISGIEKWNKK